MRTRTPELWLFVLTLGTYGFFYQAGGWNANVRFDLVRSIVERRTLDIDAYHANTGDKALVDGHYYSDKAPGLSLLSVPVYAVVHAAYGELRETDRFQGWAAYLCTLFAVSLPSAFAVVSLFRLCAFFGFTLLINAMLPLAYAFATLAFPYSTLYYGHQTAAAFVLMALSLLVRSRNVDARRFGTMVLVGLLLGGAVLVEYPAAIAVGLLGAYAGWRYRSARPLAGMALGMVGPLALLCWYQAAAFGSPFALPYDFSTQAPRHGGLWMGVGWPGGRVLYHLLIGEYRGLFFGSPWLLLAIPGIGVWLRDRRFRAEGLLCAAVPLLCLALAAGLTDWHGGWGMGPRHLILTLPFLALLAGACLDVSMRGRLPALGAACLRTAAIALATYSGCLMFVGTAVKPEVPRAVEQPFRQFLLPAFLRGDFSVNTQSVDMVTGRGRTVRQAWTLGDKMGLTGWHRLFPLLIFTILAATRYARSLTDRVKHDKRI